MALSKKDKQSDNSDVFMDTSAPIIPQYESSGFSSTIISSESSVNKILCESIKSVCTHVVKDERILFHSLAILEELPEAVQQGQAEGHSTKGVGAVVGLGVDFEALKMVNKIDRQTDRQSKV